MAVKLRDYRSQLGVVLQDNFLFDGTIAENIAYGNPHAARDDIKSVSRITHCDEFVEAFEKQYDTIVGERGTHEELLDQGGRYRQLYDKQYHFERDRFINPGEDFTPEPAAAGMPSPVARPNNAL